MTPEQFEAFIQRLDQIVALLEMQTLGPEICKHENAVDLGVMGMKKGERMKCGDCGEEFSRMLVEGGSDQISQNV